MKTSKSDQTILFVMTLYFIVNLILTISIMSYTNDKIDRYNNVNKNNTINNKDSIMNINNTPIAINQVWVKKKSDDPFEPIHYDTIVILDIKSNYAKVLWKIYRMGYGYEIKDTTSFEISTIIATRKLVK